MLHPVCLVTWGVDNELPSAEPPQRLPSQLGCQARTSKRKTGIGSAKEDLNTFATTESHHQICRQLPMS